MAVIRDSSNVRRNLKLNDNYISNDGGDEGISIDNSGVVTMTKFTSTATSNVHGALNVGASSSQQITNIDGNGVTATATCAGHGIATGDKVRITHSTSYNDTHVATAINSTQFTFPHGASTSNEIGTLHTTDAGDITCYSRDYGEGLEWDGSESTLTLKGVSKLHFYDDGGGESIVADDSGKLTISAGAEIQVDTVKLDVDGNINVTGVYKVDDTEVISGTALASAVKLNNANWSGTDLSVANGGTGVSSFSTLAVVTTDDSSGTGALVSKRMNGSGELLIGGVSGPEVGTITADDGLAVTVGDGTIELDLDLKSNGGLVIESNKAAVDLGASSITGTLAVSDGGTGVSTLDNLITLGDHTTGPYVATLTAGALIDLQNNSGETASPTVDVDLSELTDGTADVVGSADELVYLDDGSQKRKQIDEIKLGQFNNDAGWTNNSGTVTEVGTTGTVNGLTLTGTVISSGSLTLGGTLAINNSDWSGADLSVANGGTGASDSNAWLNSRITTNANGSLNYDATGATAVNHDSLTGFVADEHIDWTASSAGTVHSTNIPTLNQSTTGTAAIATTVTLTDNEDADEENPIWFSAGAAGSGNIGAEADGTLTYNPSSGTLTATTLVGAHGNADSAVQPADTFYIGTTSIAHNRGSGALTLVGLTLTTPDIGTPSAGILTNCTFPTLNQNTSGTAAIATTVTISDNEDADEENAILFSAGADADGGNLGIEQDHSGMTYNPSTGGITATLFTGNVTGDVSGSAATVTGSSQAITALTGGDLTIYEDANNADVSLKMGTSATEALSIEVLNGASNKTAEEIKIMTKTDSETENHGKISVYIDEVEIFDIDDGGIDMASGKTVAINGTDITGGGASSLSDLADFSRGTDAVSSGNYQTLMPNVGDWYYREGQAGGPELYIRQSTYIVEKLDPNEWSSSDSLTFTPEVPTATDIDLVDSSGSNLSSTKLVGYSVTAYAKCEYNSAVSGALDNTPRAYFSGSVVSNTYKDLDGTDNTLTTSGLSISSNARDESLSVSWTGTTAAGANITEGGVDVANDAGTDSMYFRNLVIWGSCAGNTNTAILSGIDARAGTSSSTNQSGNGGSIFGSSGTTGYIYKFSYTSSTNYNNDSPYYEREWTIPSGSYFLIAYPENNQNDITSILLDGFQGDYAGDCTTGTVTYENDEGFSESYRYHISTEIFNASTTVKMTKAR